MAGHLNAWSAARRAQFDLNRVRLIRRRNRIAHGERVLREHREIYDAVKAQCPERAEARMRRHIGDLYQQTGTLFKDPSLMGLIELPQAR